MNFKTAFNRFIERQSRLRTRNALLSLSDHQLYDAGYSRELLNIGLEAWPWRTGQLDEETLLNAHARLHENATKTQQNRRAIREAIAELEHYSDRELADIGISRHTIEESVTHGRLGYERAA